MKNVLSILLLMGVLAPQLSLAQGLSLTALLGADSQRYCQETWQGAGDHERRLFQACLREQQQAEITLRTLHGRYATQDFYRATALPYCRESQGQGAALNLVQLSFCLEDEINGFQALQDLRRRYGAARVDSTTREALSASGSWAIAASQVKRSTHLKTLRSGTGS